MKRSKKHPVIKNADEIIDTFTGSVDIVEANTVFTRLFAGYALMHATGKPMHPLDPCNQDPLDENYTRAIRAIGTLLNDIENSMKAVG